MAERNWDQILDRLQKIKTLADRAGTVGEAEAAMAKLQGLLFQYNLSLADLDGKTDNKTEYIMTDLEFRNSGWKVQLANAVCNANFCRAVNKAKAPGVWLIGEDHNLIVVKDMLLYLIEAIERLADEAASDPAFRNMHGKTFKSTFAYGAVSSINRRLNRQRQEDVSSANASALVLVKDEELNQAVNGFFDGSVKTVRRRINANEGAYARGIAAGNGIGLDRQISGRNAGNLALRG